jgi:hypothetical protein
MTESNYEAKITAKKGIIPIIYGFGSFLLVTILPFLESLPAEYKTGIVIMVIGILTAITNYIKHKDD